MPITGLTNMISESDNRLPNPLKYPGKYNRKNKNGTLKSRPEWVVEEVRKWIDFMKENEKYDQSYHSVKTKVLVKWLKKTFSQVSHNDIKQLLYDLEKDMDDTKSDNNNEYPTTENPDSETDQDKSSSDSLTDEEGPTVMPSSPDMFEEGSGSDMEMDTELSRDDKERLIHGYVISMDKNMLINEESLPEFVRNSHSFKRKKEEYILQFVDSLFESLNSQEVAVNYSQLPEFVKSNPYIDKKLDHHKKKQLSDWRVMKSLNGSLNKLQQNHSQEAYNQRVQLVASVICPRYGVPQVDETQSVIAAAKALNRSFLTGEQENLSVKPHKKE